MQGDGWTPGYALRRPSGRDGPCAAAGRRAGRLRGRAYDAGTRRGSEPRGEERRGERTQVRRMSPQDKKRKGPQTGKGPQKRKGPQAARGRRATAGTVEAVMVTDVVTVAPSATLADAARTME